MLQEYARIAFADPRHIADWKDGELHVKTSGDLSEADAAPISEIVAGSSGGPVRVKLYDKKAALDAIARYLGMFPLAPRRSQDDVSAEVGEDWSYRARKNQEPPPGDWRVWLLLAGRGFGKTRTGAELVRSRVGACTARRIALVAPTAADARNVMVEGESGILAISPARDRPIYEPSKRRVSWPNGAVATLFSADEPERLRGPQHDFAWCDELAAWRYPAAWDMLMFGLRLGIVRAFRLASRLRLVVPAFDRGRAARRGDRAVKDLCSDEEADRGEGIALAPIPSA